MSRTNGLLSIIAPAMNEQDNIVNLCEKIDSVFTSNNIPYELIIIDDGSKDKTWSIINEQSDKNPKIKGLSFSRNFGKESAMKAGLTEATGDCAAIIDADLQFPPETLVEMYRKWEANECDLAEGKKISRQKESFIYKAFSKTFYGLLKAMSGIDLNNMCDFKLMDRAIIDILIALPEKQRFFRALSDWPGFRKVIVPFEVLERSNGKSKFTPIKLIKLALGSISSFSSVPLQFSTFLGFIHFILSFILCIFTLIFKFNNHSNELFCWLAVILLAISGAVFIALGIIGFYLARMYEEIKSRPEYIIAQKTSK